MARNVTKRYHCHEHMADDGFWYSAAQPPVQAMALPVSTQTSQKRSSDETQPNTNEIVGCGPEKKKAKVMHGRNGKLRSAYVCRDKSNDQWFTDTKRWVSKISQSMPDKQHLLQCLKLEEEIFDIWYCGEIFMPTTTRNIRARVDEYMSIHGGSRYSKFKKEMLTAESTASTQPPNSYASVLLLDTNSNLQLPPPPPPRHGGFVEAEQAPITCESIMQIFPVLRDEGLQMASSAETARVVHGVDVSVQTETTEKPLQCNVALQTESAAETARVVHGVDVSVQTEPMEKPLQCNVALQTESAAETARVVHGVDVSVQTETTEKPLQCNAALQTESAAETARVLDKVQVPAEAHDKESVLGKEYLISVRKSVVGSSCPSEQKSDWDILHGFRVGDRVRTSIPVLYPRSARWRHICRTEGVNYKKAEDMSIPIGSIGTIKRITTYKDFDKHRDPAFPFYIDFDSQDIKQKQGKYCLINQWINCRFSEIEHAEQHTHLD